MHTSRKLAIYSVFVTGLLIGICIPRPIIGAAHANPQDVHGSPGVCVSSYTNSAGSWMLWADGHVTNAYSAANETNSFNTTTQFGTPTKYLGVLGSPNVPTGVLQTVNGTYVAFADGSVKQPASVNASAAPSGGYRMVWGFFTPGGPGAKQPVVASSSTGADGLPDFTITTDKAGANPSKTMYVVYNTPFSVPPAVTCSDSALASGQMHLATSQASQASFGSYDNGNDLDPGAVGPFCFMAVGPP